MRKIILISSLFIFFINSAYTQNCGWNEINEANYKYNEGNFSDALNLLNNCLQSNIDLNQRVEALRLESKIYLALDNDSAAFSSAKEIIELNSKFEPNYLTDPQSFIEIITNIKKLSQEFEVVSISKKAENINKAPATAIVLSSKDIKERGYLDFEEMLHDLPGFDISRSNGNLYAHVYQRGYRSINTNRTLFLIDGVEDNDLWSSNVYLSRQFIMSNVKSMEVVYGPASTMYGSNAFLGVINIISKEPKDIIKPDKIFGTDIRVGYGSYNTKFIDGTIAMQTKDHNIGLMLSARGFLSNERDLSIYPNHDYAPANMTTELSSQYQSALTISDSAQVDNFLANYPSSSNLYYLDSTSNSIIPTQLGIQTALEYDNVLLNNTTFSDKTEAYSINFKLKVYDFTLGYYYWQKAEGPGSQYNDLAYLGFDQGQSWRPVHHFLYVKYDKQINEKLNFTNFLRFKTHYLNRNTSIVTWGSNYLNGDYGLDALVEGYIPTADSIYLYYKSNQLRNETKLLYQISTNTSFVGGIETRFSSIQGDYYIGFSNNVQETGFIVENMPGGNQFFTKDIGAYLQGNIGISKIFNITVGGRYDFNKVRLKEGYGSVFNERVAVVYSPSSFIFRAIFATAFKDATYREKYSTAPSKRELQNPTLEPEKVKNFELAIAKQFNDNNIINISFYDAYYSNIIQEVSVLRNDGTYTNQNQAIGKAHIYGINAYGNMNFNKISLYLNYTFTQPFAIDLIDINGEPELDSLGNPITKLRISDIANHRANIGANYKFKKVLNFNVRCNYVGTRVTGVNTNVPTNTSVFKPYFLLNSTISYTPSNSGFTIQITGLNLLNTEYFEPGLDNASGALASMLAQNRFNIYLSINYKF